MPKQPIKTPRAPAAIGPYSQGVDLGSLAFTSGQLGIDPSTGTLPESVEAQARQSLGNVAAVLKAAGLEMSDVVKTLVFVKNMADFAKVNAIYAEFFRGEVLPARSCVEAAALPKGALVEIEAIACRK